MVKLRVSLFHDLYKVKMYDTNLFKINLVGGFFLGLDKSTHEFKKFSVTFPFSKGTLHVLEVIWNANISFHSSLKGETPEVVWVREPQGIIRNVLKVVNCYSTGSKPSMLLIKDDVTLCQILEEVDIIKGPSIPLVEDKLGHSCSQLP